MSNNTLNNMIIREYSAFTLVVTFNKDNYFKDRKGNLHSRYTFRGDEFTNDQLDQPNHLYHFYNDLTVTYKPDNACIFDNRKNIYNDNPYKIVCKWNKNIFIEKDNHLGNISLVIQPKQSFIERMKKEGIIK